MSTVPPFHDTILTRLFGKTRRAVLGLLYGHSDEEYYLREIARSTGAALGAVQREVKQLLEAGVIKRSTRGNQTYYRANPNSPIFEELRGLVRKTSGLADVLKDAIAPFSERVALAFVYGSMARGEEVASSDVDLLVVGRVKFREVVKCLQKAQKALGREINPTVYPPPEFRRKLAAGDHFLKTVLQAPKIFLKGNDHELKRMGKKKLAQKA